MWRRQERAAGLYFAPFTWLSAQGSLSLVKFQHNRAWQQLSTSMASANPVIASRLIYLKSFTTRWMIKLFTKQLHFLAVKKGFLSRCYKWKISKLESSCRYIWAQCEMCACFAENEPKWTRNHSRGKHCYRMDKHLYEKIIFEKCILIILGYNKNCARNKSFFNFALYLFPSKLSTTVNVKTNQHGLISCARNIAQTLVS